MGNALYTVGASWNRSSQINSDPYFDPRPSSTSNKDESNRLNNELVWNERHGSILETDPGTDGFILDSGFYEKRFVPSSSLSQWLQLADRNGTLSAPVEGPLRILAFQQSPNLDELEPYKKIQKIEILNSSLFTRISTVRSAPGSYGLPITNALIANQQVGGLFMNGFLAWSIPDSFVDFVGCVIAVGQEIDYRLDYPWAERQTCTITASGSYRYEGLNSTSEVSIPSNLGSVFTEPPDDGEYSGFVEKSLSDPTYYGYGNSYLSFALSEGNQTMTVGSLFPSKSAFIDSVTDTVNGLNISMTRDESDSYVYDLFGRKVDIDVSTALDWKPKLTQRQAGLNYTYIKGAVVRAPIRLVTSCSTPVNYIEVAPVEMGTSWSWLELDKTGWRVGSI